MLLLRLILIMKLCGKRRSNKGIVNTTYILPAKFILEAHFTLSWDVQRSNEWQTLKRRDNSQLSKSKYNDTINEIQSKACASISRRQQG
jgi:hypothetical protein